MIIPVRYWEPSPNRLSYTEDGKCRADWYRMGLMNCLLEFKPKVCVEIGTRTGHTAKVFYEYFKKHCRDGTLITCDIGQFCSLQSPGVKQVKVYPHSMEAVDVDRTLPQDTLLPDWREKVGQSVNENTNMILKAMAGQLADFIYIDGDHTRNGVAKDWEIAKYVCRQEFVAVFNDVQSCRNDCTKWYQEEIVGKYDSTRFEEWPVYCGMGCCKVEGK